MCAQYYWATTLSSPREQRVSVRCVLGSRLKPVETSVAVRTTARLSGFQHGAKSDFVLHHPLVGFVGVGEVERLHFGRDVPERAELQGVL